MKPELDILWQDEKPLNIPISGGKSADARLMGSLNDEVILLAHGLASTIDRTLSFSLASALYAMGHNVVRLNFYGEGEHRRRLSESTIYTHASDLDSAIDWIQAQGATTVTPVGHSFGGLAVLLSRQNFVRAVLIDPSHPAVSPFKTATWETKLDRYVYQSKGFDYLVPALLPDSFHELKPADYCRGYRTPSLLITAGSGPLVNQHAEYVELLADHCELTQSIIPGASHTFDTPTTRHLLIAEIIKYLSFPGVNHD